MVVDINDFINGKPDVLLLRYPPGGGKTTTSANELLRQNIQFAFFGGKHESLEDNISKPHGLMHLEGKARKCTNPKKTDFELYGLLDSPEVCNRCPHLQFCEYKRMRKEFYNEPQSFVAVHHHFNNIAEHLEQSKFDLYVFDENFLEAMFVGGDYHLNDLHKTQKLVLEMVDSPEREFVKELLEDLIVFVYTGQFTAPRIPASLNLFAFAEEYGRMLVDRYYRREWIHPNVLGGIINFFLLKNEKEIYRREIRKGAVREHIVELSQYDFSPLKTKTPLMILDATTPANIYKKVLKKRKVVVKEPVAIANSHLFQLTTHNYPMSYLRKEGIRKRLFEITKNVCLKHSDEEVFICIRKRFKNYLENYLEGIENANIAHYGGLRGANSFQEANVAVLIGTPIPNPDVTDVRARVMGVDRDDVFQMECNQEMLQTVHRIRPLLKDESYVYILSNMDTGYLCNDANHLPITRLENILKESEVIV